MNKWNVEGNNFECKCKRELIISRGIPYVSKDRLARMNAIAEAFADGSYDIVCLQEVWSINDFRNIVTKAQKKLPFSHYFFR